jgi:YebC/PmpR family DNA-binding regulatory protein
MSGHSKWSSIKHKKGAADAKRGQYFSKLIREITAAVKEGGNDSDSNPRLRLAIHNARGANMPKENIERAVHKGSAADTAAFTTLTYEGTFIHGTAFIIECTTDNLNRTVGNVRAIFNKQGATLGKNGSLAFLFDRKGTFIIPQDAVQDEETLTLALIEAGLEDIVHDPEAGYFYITSAVANFGALQKELEKLHITVEQSSLRYIPHTQVELDQESFDKVMKLIDLLEEDEDVQQVYHNVSPHIA